MDNDCGSGLSAEAIRIALDKLLQSKSFRAAHSQRRFLRFVVEETLAGRGSQIKEFTVGAGAFGRGDSFDPRVDPIIRTEARKLRLRLAKYYEEEGIAEPVRIELPKGSYVPVFHDSTLVDTVEEPAECAPEEEVAPPDEAAVPLAIPAPRRTAPRLFLFSLAAAAVFALILWVVPRRSTAASSEAIRILPFTNNSGDPAQDVIVSRIANSLTELLGREPGLHVLGAGSTVRVATGIASVLSGRMERDGATIRLRVRLVSQGSTAPVWSGSYVFDSTIHKVIEAEIAEEILHVLRTGKVGDQSSDLTARSVVPAALNAYREGLWHQEKQDAASLRVATARFEEAVRLNPEFALGYAALANSWVLAAQLSAVPPLEASGKIRQFATRAMQLDRTLGEPHFSLAVCAQYEYEWATAEREFRTGLALDPTSSIGHLWYAKYLALMGRHHEVLVHRTLGKDLSPRSPYAVQAVAGYWSVMGEYRQAIDGFRSALALNPDFGLARQGLGIALLLNGQFREAITELETASQVQGGLTTASLLGYAYAMSGEDRKARTMLADFEERERRGPFPALAIAHIYIGLGEKDKAFEWLEKAVDQRDLSATLKWDSLYVSLRSDGRYLRLLRRMRLV